MSESVLTPALRTAAFPLTTWLATAFFCLGRKADPGGKLPKELPKVCIQLPMYEEIAVAQRVIEQTCLMDWPHDRLEIQINDDSQDPVAKRIVEDAAAQARERGINCNVINRPVRKGYKAGALEYGRRLTDAEFIAIFDADFMPTTNYLQNIIPHFYDADAESHLDLGMV